MGTASIKKFLKQIAGTLTEEAALTTSAGSGDQDRIPALNSAGVLDITIINGTSTSAGSGSSGKTPVLDVTGRLDQSFMPVGVVPETLSIVASEDLADGDFVNVWNNAGVANVRKADATTSGKECMGFVLASYLSAATAIVYFEGSNTHCTSLTPGALFLSTTAGTGTDTAPTGSGNIVQRLGTAVSATTVTFEAQPPIVLA